ncbi:ICAM3 protein, partial [Atlantisia rogersi]|nr:ICAM3 protein [Atlantisia rogersi]
MDPHRCCAALALLCFLVPGGHPGPCRVSISPEEPMVEFGSPLLLNCTSSCQNYSRLSWEVSVPKKGEQGPGWVSLNITSVTDWSLELQCFGVFGAQREITATPLRAYQFSPPQVSLEGDVVAGREARVICVVSARVPPSDPLDLNLTLGGGGLPPSTQRGPSAVLAFTARPEQHGQEVTCEAALRLGRLLLNASASTALRV